MQKVAEKITLDTVNFYWELGINVLPIGSDKRPLDFLDWKRWQTERQAWSDAKAFDWSRATGIAAITGAVSNSLLAIDIDKGNADESLQAMLYGLSLSFAYQWIVRSGSQQGFHIWLACPGLNLQGKGKAVRKTPSGGQIELRWHEHYTILPPSNHPSGATYEFMHGIPSDGLAFMPPETVLEAFDFATVEPEAKTAPPPTNRNGVQKHDSDRESAYVEAAVGGELEILRATKQGGRNEALNRAAFKLGGLIGQGGLTRAELEAALIDAARATGLKDSEILPTMQSGLNDAMTRTIPEKSDNGNGAKKSNPAEKEILNPPTIDLLHLTDLGNARRLIERFKGKLLYCAAWESWLVWRKSKWELDATLAIERMAKRVIRDIPSEAEGYTGKRKKAILQWAVRSQSSGKIQAMINVARSEQEVVAKPEDFDNSPMLLNCLNGVVDLTTGKRINHDPTQKMVKQVQANYDPSAACPVWDSFLLRIMDGNQTLVDFLQRAVGYSLTGLTNEQVVFFLYGTGSNGKSTFLNALRFILNDYSRNTPTSTLMRKKDGGNGASDDLARLMGIRMVTAIETDENQYLSEATIKALTGDDMITARHLYSGFFDFKPQLKIWLACNHKPIITGMDNGIWRRIRLIPFTVTIGDSEKDPDLAKKLENEAQGILRWAVEGCLKWQQERLGNPPEVAAAVQSYRSEMDVLAAFISDFCVVTPNAVSAASALYDAYQKWCQETGERVISQRKLGQKLLERGFKPARATGGSRLWQGIGIRSDASDTMT